MLISKRINKFNYTSTLIKKFKEVTSDDNTIVLPSSLVSFHFKNVTSSSRSSIKTYNTIETIERTAEVKVSLHNKQSNGMTRRR